MISSRPLRRSSAKLWRRRTTTGMIRGMTVPAHDAPDVLRAAREDAGMTQSALAQAVGARQTHIAGIESGRRPVSPDLLARLLAAADYRPSLALAAHRDELLDLGATLGVRTIRVFGSVARGTDHHSSDIDLFIDLDPDAGPLAYATFVAGATEILGFAVDVVINDDDAPSRIRRTAIPL
ncbi:helix-turn-helix domain-containing protein [Brachybacterium tyrofermentans]